MKKTMKPKAMAKGPKATSVGKASGAGMGKGNSYKSRPATPIKKKF